VASIQVPTATIGARPIDRSAARSWRHVKSQLMAAVLGLSFVVVAVPLLLVLWSVVTNGLEVMSWEFLTTDIAASERRTEGGVGPAIVGTLQATGIATLLAVPLGVLGAVYLHEYGRQATLARLVRFMATVMSGVPSIVMGLFVYVMWTLTFGLSALGAGIALGCLMLPVVIRSTEEMLRLVPEQLREGALALGTTKSRTVLTVVLPAALPGIVSGCLLAVARAAGETAPLIFTIGAAKALNIWPFSGANTALPREIYSNASSTFDSAQARGWGAALTLIVIAFLFTLVARLVSARFALKR
jgi:phosphate transport system permease protein